MSIEHPISGFKALLSFLDDVYLRQNPAAQRVKTSKCDCANDRATSRNKNLSVGTQLKIVLGGN